MVKLGVMFSSRRFHCTCEVNIALCVICLCVFLLLPCAAQPENFTTTDTAITTLARAAMNVFCGYFARRTSAVYLARCQTLTLTIGILKNIHCDITWFMNTAETISQQPRSASKRRYNIFLIQNYVEFR